LKKLTLGVLQNCQREQNQKSSDVFTNCQNAQKSKFLDFTKLSKCAKPKGGGWAKPKNGEAHFWEWVGGAV